MVQELAEVVRCEECGVEMADGCECCVGCSEDPTGCPWPLCWSCGLKTGDVDG